MGTPAGGICPYRVKVGRKRKGERGTEGGRREADPAPEQRKQQDLGTEQINGQVRPLTPEHCSF